MRNKILVILVLMMVLTGCKKAETTEILLSDDCNISGESAHDDSLQVVGETIPDASCNSSNVTIENPQTEKETLVIFVCGAVVTPGVYYLEDGSRIVDAIDAAGGFLEDADKNYVNLAAPIEDGIKLLIPTVEETKMALEEAPSGVIDNFDNQSSVNTGGLVNINKASKEELKTLPGIGDGIAGKIIDYRNTNGNFTCIEDIKKVSGIKDKLFAKIKEYITV